MMDSSYRLSQKGDWGKPLFGRQRAVSPRNLTFILYEELFYSVTVKVVPSPSAL